ncbi:PQQ-binding-like beta-propeller repeat protein [Siphonobacter sp. SORGH_AS_1065]|uniref:outer membrane protein assembly factor BamB family protein n=1 Tax=Siphonobacter sp. SORGH_AS_1065 TaxID=3041795 RepID=UPI002782080D|nr:PQQ-binding-like beta-propeller repeat protein [Siphonobacter sp. SORGH_AS_1065]MDQ1090122.1 quinoprotein glucose dehydrogenase [Siphonobacter sp. SORGH_AS_1065]
MLRFVLLLFGLLCLLSNCHQSSETETTEWPFYGGNAAGNRYSELREINVQNVSSLKVAWTYHAAKGENPFEMQCQPIMVNGILYGTTPLLKLFALKADTGEELWKFDPFENQIPTFHPIRGVTYWPEGKRIFYTAGSRLFALEAETGKLVEEFGERGSIDLHVGVGDHLDHHVDGLPVDATSPGIIYKHTLVLGSRVGEGGDAAPGSIRGFDVRTGKLTWIFHTIPHPGEFGYDTWPKEAWKYFGAANNWGGMVLDEKRGVVYLGTGSASSDFYGGAREGQNLFSDCILALDAETGKRKWHFQTIHHDLWDRDIPCPPNLTTITHQGKKLEVVTQTTKDGLVYVLNRDTGESLFPLEERAVPTDGLPGEKPYPTQLYPSKPAPLTRQFLTEEDITDRTPEARAFVLKRFRETRSGNKFIPPSKEGTLMYGMGGGAEWGGSAIDENGILYQNANEMIWDLGMEERKKQVHRPPSAEILYLDNCSICHGGDKKGSGTEYPNLSAIASRLTKQDLLNIMKTGRGRMPSFQHLPDQTREAIADYLLNLKSKVKLPAQPVAKAPKPGTFPYEPPYVNTGWKRFLDPDGYPAIKPPWGTLNAIDLNTGEYLWRVPLGEFPALTQRGMPVTGTESYGGPLVTAGGLVFIAATKDERFRAFDKKTGKVVWEYQLPAGGFATPMTYQMKGKQYIVLAVGGSKNGHKPGGYYLAFSL